MMKKKFALVKMVVALALLFNPVVLGIQENVAHGAQSATDVTLPQATIGKMYSFIENNSATNPFIIPAGLTFDQAINAIDWGEGVTVLAAMSGLGEAPGTVAGAIILYLNALTVDDEIVFDDDYFFADVILHYQFEETQNTQTPATTATAPQNLPQTGMTTNLLTILSGTALLAGGLSIAIKKKK